MRQTKRNQLLRPWSGLWLTVMLSTPGCFFLVGSGGTRTAPSASSFLSGWWFFDSTTTTSQNAHSAGTVQAFSPTASSANYRRRKHHPRSYHQQDVSLLLRTSSSRSGEESNEERGDTTNNNNEEEDPVAAEARRMATVRYLQHTFYNSNHDHPTNDDGDHDDSSRYVFTEPNGVNGGWLQQLPLFRVNWVELPGRTNVLNIFEPIYTNMFEQLLRTDQCYFGHVYLDGGSKNMKNVPQCDWQTSKSLPAATAGTVVLGTLMRITDYRRLPNGRLWLLVQAMERFVVMNVVQNLPYGRADVQLLPDVEEEDDHDDDTATTTNTTTTRSLSRTDVILRNWAWKNYEFEDTKFAAQDLVGSVLAQVLPYVAMDTHQLPPNISSSNSNNTVDTIRMWPPNKANTAAATASTTNTTTQSTVQFGASDQDGDGLEQQLLEKGILKQRTKDDDPLSAVVVAADELELQLWWALNDYLIWSKTPVSPILLGLLPPGVDWADDFILKGLADQLQTTVDYRHKYRPVSSLYPKRMRQRRLSYHAAYVCQLDQHVDRTELLALTSTTMRMPPILSFGKQLAARCKQHAVAARGKQQALAARCSQHAQQRLLKLTMMMTMMMLAVIQISSWLR
jgi:Lon protease-like protein